MKKKKHKFINGTKGFISLLVLVTLLPFYSLAALLEESGRYQASTKSMDEAVSGAAVSTLGDYDKFLLKRFGLTSISQENSTEDSDDRDFMEDTFKKYLLAQQLQGTKSFDVGTDDISVEGVYPLGDVNALEEEVVQYSAIRIPVEAGEDLLDLDELIKKLESDSGICKVLGLVNSGVDLVDKYTGVYTTMTDLGNKIDSFKDPTDQDYRNAFQAWKDAVTDYTSYKEQCESDDDETDSAPSEDETEEEKQAREAAEEERKKKEEEEARILQEKKNTVETKKEEFKSATTDEYNKLTEINKAMQDAATSLNNAMDETVSFTHDAANFSIEKQADEATGKDNKKTDSDEEEKKTQQQKDYEDAIQVVKDNGKTVEDTIYNGYDKTVEDANQVLETYNNANLAQCLQDLNTNSQKISTFQAEDMPGDDMLVDCSEFTDSGKIFEFVDEAENSTDLDDVITYLVDLCKAVASIFELNYSYDPELNTTIEANYFSNLPSKRQDGRYALKNPYGSDDEQMAMRYIEAYAPEIIDQNVRVKDMSGLQKAITALVNQVPIFVGCGLRLKTNLNILQLLPLLREFFKSGKTLVEDILQVQKCMDEVDASSTEIMSMLRSRIGRRALVMGYLTYTLSNRTTYKSFTSQGGLSDETDESLAESLLRINYPIATDIFEAMFNNPTSGRSFAGCELEYICAGNASERQNQIETTNMIYGVRMIMDLISIFTNEEFLTVLDSVSAIVPLGTLLGVLYALVVAVGEPALDTLFLANGTEEPLYKKTIYLTPTGLISLADDLMNVTIFGDNKLKDKKKELKEEVESLKNEKTPGNSSGKSGTQNTTDTSGKGNTSSGKGSKVTSKSKLKKIGSTALENINKISYTQHCLLMMVLAGDYYQYLKRLQDIIQMESWQYAHYAGSDAGDRVTGEYDNFDIDKAYTCLRIEVSGTFKPVLPVPKLTDQQLLLNYHRVMYRGY